MRQAKRGDSTSRFADVFQVTRLFASNYRGFKSVDIEIRPFTVVVGPNNAGKSSLLYLLSLFGEIARNPSALSDFFVRGGGFRANQCLLAELELMELGLGFAPKGVSLAPIQYYQLVLRPEGGTFFVDTEEHGGVDSNGQRKFYTQRIDARVFQRGNDGMSNELVEEHLLHGQDLLFPQRMDLTGCAMLLEAIQDSSHWEMSRFHTTEKSRAPQRLMPADVPLADGSNLLSVLHNLKAVRKDRWRELVENLRLAIPEFEDIDFPAAGSGHIYLTWTQRGLRAPLGFDQLSDGTIRLLWILTLIATALEGGMILIDEPELSLHPQWIQLIVALLRDAAVRSTVVIATQSVELVRWLEPRELLLADMTECGTQFTWADAHPNIDDWLKDFTLGDLWTMGELGGRR